MPALLTSTSIRPKAATTVAMPASTWRSLVTSLATAIARPPARLRSSAVRSAPAASRSNIASLAPARAKVRAISLPMPLAPPVTTATWSLRRCGCPRPCMLEVVLRRDLVGARRPIEADLADVGEQAGARTAEIIPRDTIPAVQQILPVEREPPRAAVGGEREAGIDQAVRRLVGHAGGRIRNLDEAAPIPADASEQGPRRQIPNVRGLGGHGPGRCIDGSIQ